MINRQIILLFAALLTLGCNSKSNREGITKPKIEPTKQSVSTDPTTFNFAAFRIGREQLGPIRIGMTIKEAERLFSGLKKEEQDAGCFGFDGGGSAFLYSLSDKLVFAFIPTYGTDTIRYIIAAHQKLTTINGLNPNSTVQELTKAYSDFHVLQGLMNGWEFFNDEENNWTFAFMTDEDNQIGEYPELEKPSKPKRFDIEADWIEIR